MDNCLRYIMEKRHINAIIFSIIIFELTTYKISPEGGRNTVPSGQTLPSFGISLLLFIQCVQHALAP